MQSREDLGQLDVDWDALSASEVQAAGRPSLARLAYNRLGFGPNSDSVDFGDDWNAFVSYVDQQLAYESINDSACDLFVNLMKRTDDAGLQIPPLTADINTIEQYRTAYTNSTGYGPEWTMYIYAVNTTIARALLSRRQLWQVMTDFWANHFNTLAWNVYKCWEDTYVFRTNALGNFRTLLGMDAKNPLMLEYLSNTWSDGNNPNENYARELMELHTMGSKNRIPGHPRFGKANYTEEDVHTVAQIFSGWTSLDLDYNQRHFRFNDTENWPTHHWAAKRIKLDNTAYTHFFAQGGIEQGEQMLDILASHPSTAYRIAWKLCQRLISDTPDVSCPGAINAGMNAFLSTNGDLRATVRALLLYQEPGKDFASSWGWKIKRPLEFLVSAMRVLDITEYPPPSAWWDEEFSYHLALLGQELFQCHPPTGYADVKQFWWSSTQLVRRWELANRLVQVAFEGQSDDSPSGSMALERWIGNTGTPPTATVVVTRATNRCFGYAVSAADRTSLINYLGNGNPNAPITSSHPRLRPFIALLLASSYFQWR